MIDHAGVSARGAFPSRGGRRRWLPATLIAFSGMHVFALGVAELLILRQAGFMAMYGFRLVYYLLLHIGWGWLRHVI